MQAPFDAVAEIYDDTRGPPADALRQLVKVLAAELQGCKRVLDVGVGTGRLAEPLQAAGINVVGADIARLMLAKARQKALRNLVRGDARFLPFRDGAFDASICMHVLHLIPEWKQALSEICRAVGNIMLSAIYTSKNPIFQSYSALLKQRGYEPERTGTTEEELRNLIKPWKSVSAASFESSADQLLEHLRVKAYSSQWGVPDRVNQKIVSSLRMQFSGKTFPAKLGVIIWNIKDLQESAELVSQRRANY